MNIEERATWTVRSEDRRIVVSGASDTDKLTIEVDVPNTGGADGTPGMRAYTTIKVDEWFEISQAVHRRTQGLK